MKRVIFDPHPRTPELIFTDSDWAELNRCYEIVEPPAVNDLQFYQQHIAEADYVIGQPPLNRELLGNALRLKAIINVESNFLDNMDYDTCFERGIHVLATSPVFAMPVAELGLGLALSLLRDIPVSHLSFAQGTEVYGLESNQQAAMISGSHVGFIGYGDLGVALHSLLKAFQCEVSAYDPWLPDSMLAAMGAIPATLDKVLSSSQLLFVVAAATDTNQGVLGASEFARMPMGASMVLLSRAGVVDFPAMVNAVKSGHIRVATDVFPQEPVAADDPIRETDGFILSAHRAGALNSAFTQMGHIVLEDMKLMDAGLAPRLCKRAERETVRRFRSKPVEIN